MKKKVSINRKGIILAGGTGSRLHPLTQIISKQLLPVYNKPMIFYPLSVLMLANIKDILIISDNYNLPLFKKFLGNGKHFGINLSYAIQKEPRGIAESIIIGEKFIKNSHVALILGDNIFFGDQFGHDLKKISQDPSPSIFLYHVPDPERYGVAKINSKGQVTRIDEKPKSPKSNYIVTGLYFYDSDVVNLTKKLKYSKRGELEISELNQIYIDQKKLKAHFLSRTFNWFDTGTFDSLNDASNLIRTLEKRQETKIGSPYEVSLRNQWITKKELFDKSNYLSANDIDYLKKIR